MPFEGRCPNHLVAIVVPGDAVERRWIFGAREGSEGAYGFQGGGLRMTLTKKMLSNAPESHSNVTGWGTIPPAAAIIVF